MKTVLLILAMSCQLVFGQNLIQDSCYLNGPDQSQAVSPWVADFGWFVRDKYSNPVCPYTDDHRAVDWKCLKNGNPDHCVGGPASIGRIYQIVDGQGAGAYGFQVNYAHLTVSAVFSVWGVNPDGSWDLLWIPVTRYHCCTGSGTGGWDQSEFMIMDLPAYPQFAVELTADLLMAPEDCVDEIAAGIKCFVRDTGIKTNGWWFGRYGGTPSPEPTPEPCTGRNCPPPDPVCDPTCVCEFWYEITGDRGIGIDCRKLLGLDTCTGRNCP